MAHTRKISIGILFCLMGIFLFILVIDNNLIFFPFTTIKLSNRTARNVPVNWCYDEELNESIPGILPNMHDVLPNKRPVIFFIETTCDSRSAGKIVLNARQACSVESAAKTNPNSDIYVLLVGATTINVKSNSTNDRRIRSLLFYPNIFFRNLNLQKYTKNTPIEKLYRSKAIHRSKFVIVHMSDVLRLLTLWKYGGTYLDLDMMSITPLEQLPENYAGTEDKAGYSINNAIINFGKVGIGHRIAQKCLQYINFNYNPYKWAENGPNVLTRIIKSYCKGNVNISINATPNNCNGFRVYLKHAFYLISEEEHFFNENSSSLVLLLVYELSKAIHFWNSRTFRYKVKKNSMQAYNLIAEEFCPKVYEHEDEYF